MSDYQDSDQEIRQRIEKRLAKRGEYLIHLPIFIAINLILWVIWLNFTPGIFPWPLVLTLPWGAGLLAHGIDTYEQTSGRRAAARERAISEELHELFGEESNASREDYARTRQRVTQRFTKNREFLMHLSVYIPINLLLWLLWAALTGASGFPFPALVTLGWGVGVIGHAIDAYLGVSSTREKTIQREIARERERLYGDGPQKAKRKRDHLELSDDGELVEVVEDEWEEDEKAKRR